MEETKSYDIAVIGGGFTGLSAAYEIAKTGLKVAILEKEQTLGGIADSFYVDGKFPLEKFYHHWFRNDKEICDLAKEFGIQDQLLTFRSRTGLFWKGNYYKLSSPFDLLGFKPLSFLDRIRLGLLVPRTKLIKQWKKLESVSAEEWLLKYCGKNTFEILWQPLLKGKFSEYASEISAVWFWNKIMLRGNSRDPQGFELLLYPQDGFGVFIDQIADKLRSLGVNIYTGSEVRQLETKDNNVSQIKAGNSIVKARYFLATTPLPTVASLLQNHCSDAYIKSLTKIKHLANLCLILVLNQPLSDLYWINVSDPTFPFVGIINHTNFTPPEMYGNQHIVYLSTYLREDDPFFLMSNEEILNSSVPHIKKIFPRFEDNWINSYHVFSCRNAQPIVGFEHSKAIPRQQSPIDNFFFSTMAQIYPEDRGTNYAVREGRKIGRRLAQIAKP